MVPVVLGSERVALCGVKAAGLGHELSLAISFDPAVAADIRYGLMGAPDLRSAVDNPPGEETPLCGGMSLCPSRVGWSSHLLSQGYILL